MSLNRYLGNKVRADMRIGIWKGSTPERVHVARTNNRIAACGASSLGESPAEWRTWPGTLHEVDCKRCLLIERGKARRRLQLVEGRLAGKRGVQRDAFEGRQ